MKNSTFPAMQTEENNWIGELFIDLLNDVYYSEKAFAKIIPRLINNTNSEELADNLKEYLEISRKQDGRIKAIFTLIEETPVTKRCERVANLITEAEEILKNAEPGALLDSAIVLIGQKMVDYEIESYRTLCSLSKTLDESEVTTLLEKNLKEKTQGKESLLILVETIMNTELPQEVYW